MKKQYDVCLIYLSYVFEIIGLLAFKYFDNYISTHWITIGTDGNLIYGEVGLLYNLSVVIHYLFYFIIFVYFFMMIKKVVSKECIDLKRNTFLLFGLLVIDLVMYHFSIMTMFHYSSAITFMCVGLIINMVLYLKYRTYLINN